MTQIFECDFSNECVQLLPDSGLFLKPAASISIAVQLPRLTDPLLSVTSWSVREKLLSIIDPQQVLALKVTKSSLEYVRFECELASRVAMKTVLTQLSQRTIKLADFPDQLRVRAAENKPVFPARHDWDSYFRDRPLMNEMRPGERPDTVHVQGVPRAWFLSPGRDQVSEAVVRAVFQTFGDLRCIDVPCLDGSRRVQPSFFSSLGGSPPCQPTTFDAFIQYKEYGGFVKAMTALRGMRLACSKKTVRAGDQEQGALLVTTIHVDFDRTKHMCERNVKKRRLEREAWLKIHGDQEKIKVQKPPSPPVQPLQRPIEQKKSRDPGVYSEQLEQKIRRRRELIAARQMTKKSRSDQVESRKEQVKVQRELEAIRLLDEIVHRVEETQKKASAERKELELKKKLTARLAEKVRAGRKELELKKKLTARFIDKYKSRRKTDVQSESLLEREMNLRGKLTSIYQRRQPGRDSMHSSVSVESKGSSDGKKFPELPETSHSSDRSSPPSSSPNDNSERRLHRKRSRQKSTGKRRKSRGNNGEISSDVSERRETKRKVSKLSVKRREIGAVLRGNGYGDAAGICRPSNVDYLDTDGSGGERVARDEWCPAVEDGPDIRLGADREAKFRCRLSSAVVRNDRQTGSVESDSDEFPQHDFSMYSDPIRPESKLSIKERIGFRGDDCFNAPADMAQLAVRCWRGSAVSDVPFSGGMVEREPMHECGRNVRSISSRISGYWDQSSRIQTLDALNPVSEAVECDRKRVRRRRKRRRRKPRADNGFAQ